MFFSLACCLSLLPKKTFPPSLRWLHRNIEKAYTVVSELVNKEMRSVLPPASECTAQAIQRPSATTTCTCEPRGKWEDLLDGLVDFHGEEALMPFVRYWTKFWANELPAKGRPRNLLIVGAHGSGKSVPLNLLLSAIDSRRIFKIAPGSFPMDGFDEHVSPPSVPTLRPAPVAPLIKTPPF